MQTGYKVFEKRDGKLFSCGDIPDCLVMEYKAGVTHKPKIGKFMFCFKTLEDAQRFARGRGYRHADYEIWKVQTPKLHRITSLPAIWLTNNEAITKKYGNFDKFFEFLSSLKFNSPTGLVQSDTSFVIAGAYEGAHGAKRIKLMKQVVV